MTSMSMALRRVSLLRACMLCMVFSPFFCLSFSVAEASGVSEQASGRKSIEREAMVSKATVMNFSNNPPPLMRKLVLPTRIPTPTSVNRIGEEPETCSPDDIEIEQGPTATLPNGIPTYTVVIVNVCVTGCTISDIHVSCGWFSSATLIDPNIFERMSYDDCVVNGGEPLAAGQSLTFQYANTYSYPLSVSSVSC